MCGHMCGVRMCGPFLCGICAGTCAGICANDMWGRRLVWFGVAVQETWASRPSFFSVADRIFLRWLLSSTIVLWVIFVFFELVIESDGLAGLVFVCHQAVLFLGLDQIRSTKGVLQKRIALCI